MASVATFGSVSGKVVGVQETEYQGKKSVQITLLQNKGTRAGMALVKMPNDGRKVPEMGTEQKYDGVVYGNSNGVMFLVD
ncbi:hypothetical protein [Dehalobacter sp.]|uniref:hypothetical protein n=1 Tax=Dehalobacter sp. TaxID=1962289 RepID=UPI00258AC49E|nr:hypothetical protein [Dehalobacter sp.]MDJ0304547.1 hypothetical protein [Dehalobacter sp.]